MINLNDKERKFITDILQGYGDRQGLIKPRNQPIENGDVKADMVTIALTYQQPFRYTDSVTFFVKDSGQIDIQDFYNDLDLELCKNFGLAPEAVTIELVNKIRKFSISFLKKWFDIQPFDHYTIETKIERTTL